MPNVKASTAGGHSIGRQSALKLFSDREVERELIRDFFSRLARVGARPAKPILSFWGVGGIGKSSLLKKAVEELDKDIPSLRLLCLDLDYNRWKPTSPIADFFWHLRCQLVDAKTRDGRDPHGVEPGAFDFLYFALWRAQHPGETFNLSDSVLKDLLKSFTEGSNLLAEFSEQLGRTIPEVKELSEIKAGGVIGGVVQFFDKALVLLRNRGRRALLRKQGFDPQHMTIKEREESLAHLLCADIEQWLEDHPNDALCIALDGFERIQSTTLAEDIQNSFADWCEPLTDPDAVFAGRFGCLFFGRERNRWDELYKEVKWSERIKEYHVNGLGETDARKFLQSAAADHEAREEPTTARNLEKYADAILAAAREQRTAKEPSTFHPYYLDLAYGILYDQGAKFRPADLGRTPKELQIRFLRYLQTGYPDVFQAFRCLALAGSFDETLFDYLVTRGSISTGLQFPALTGEDYSFVEEIGDTPGTFRFHRLMELALIEDQRAKKEDCVVARKRIDVILHYCKEEAAFSKLADCTPRHLGAYQKGMTIAFNRNEDEFLDLSALDVFFSALEQPYDFTAFVSLRVGWWLKLADLWDRLRPDDIRLSEVLSGLAHMLKAQGQYAEAERHCKRALEIRAKVLGPDHPDVATSFNDLAEVYRAQDRSAEAKRFSERAREIQVALGLENAGLATTLTTLAALRRAEGHHADAEPNYQRALEIRQKVLDPKHPDVATSLNNLAALYDNQGEYAKAKPLYERALAIREEILNPEHSDIAKSLTGLADLHRAQAKYAEAEPLYQRALEIWEKALGPEHRDVALSYNGMAELYRAQGLFTKAEPLYKRALAIREKVLDPKASDVAQSLNNLAELYLAQGRYALAEPLYKRTLEIRKETLPPDHRDLATSLEKYASLLREMGRSEEAAPFEVCASAIRSKRG